MNISKETYEKALSQYYAIADIAMGCDMENIREIFREDIIIDTGDCIDVKFRDILVTFKANMCMYKEYGGKAELTNNFVYYENGQFFGVYDLVGNEITRVEVPMKILEDVLRYCENNAIYDKLSKYGDFYYKIKKIMAQHKENLHI